MNTKTESPPFMPDAQTSAMGILFALSLSHLLNDSIQALIPAIYPLLKDSLHLNFTQIGLITLAFSFTGSVLQPLVGWYTDRNPKPYALVVGMGVTMCGLILLAIADWYPLVVIAAATVGLGSAIFHPESSRMARLVSGGRHGLAQSLFQVGGNVGTAAGPLLAAWVIVPRGQRYILAFTAIALTGMAVLAKVGKWHSMHLTSRRNRGNVAAHADRFERKTTLFAMTVLLILMFSKFFYLASMTSYYTFYLIGKFGVSIQEAQVRLFLFLCATAVGVIMGGHVGDRIGRRAIIWISILGMAPFALALPHANLFWTTVLASVVGFIMASAFPAILVYATELMPGRVGMVAGLFFGLAFGIAGIASALLGKLADATSINFVFSCCAFLPLIGLMTGLLPDLRRKT